MCPAQTGGKVLDVAVDGERAKVKHGVAHVIHARLGEVSMHLGGFGGMRAPGARKGVELDLLENAGAVKHVIRPKDPGTEILDISCPFGRFVNVPESGGEGLRGKKIPDHAVYPLLILRNGAIELVVDRLELDGLLEACPGERRGEALKRQSDLMHVIREWIVDTHAHSHRLGLRGRFGFRRDQLQQGAMVDLPVLWAWSACTGLQSQVEFTLIWVTKSNNLSSLKAGGYSMEVMLLSSVATPGREGWRGRVAVGDVFSGGSASIAIRGNDPLDVGVIF